jgi:hypothetical protein
MKEINELGLKCNTLLSDFYYLNNLDSYIKLTENFLNYRIDIDEFQTRFYELRNLNCQKDVKWEDMIYIIDNLKLKEFQGLSIIINKLFTDLDVFEADPLLREDYEIGEQELRNFAEEALLKMKKYYY